MVAIPRGAVMSGNVHLRVTAVALLLTVAAAMKFALPAAQAQTFTTLYNFTGNTDGGMPSAGLSMDRAGNLYGTASAGGNKSCRPTCGTVFKLTPKGSRWVFSRIYAFSGPDGDTPQGGVIVGPDGNLYGTTMHGGASGLGVVFRLQPPPTICKAVLCPWNETVLHSFSGADGASPYFGSLVFDKAGNIFGTATGGGAFGLGAVYELSPSGGGWTQKVIYSFQPGQDAAYPYAGVVFDNAGNLYGTTTGGGTIGYGTVYELSPSNGGWTESVIYDFPGNSGGAEPFGGVIVDGSGNLYGTTFGGTTPAFELSPGNGGWTLKVLHEFDAYEGPAASLSFDSAGDLLGTVAMGTPEVFRLTPSNGQWTLTGFNGSDGASPVSTVIEDAKGNLYATASVGGTSGQGVVFEIMP